MTPDNPDNDDFTGLAHRADATIAGYKAEEAASNASAGTDGNADSVSCDYGTITGTVTDAPQNSGTILIIVGDPGLGEHNQGPNFDRAAETKREELTAQGYTVIKTRASGISKN